MQADPVIIRPMTAEDSGPIADLWVDSWRAVLPAFDFEARRAWLGAHLDALAKDGALVLVSEQEGRVSGLLTINPATGYLDQLAVARSAWGQGLARTLLDHAKALSPRRIELHVNFDNPRAVRFYEREGFVKIGEAVSELSRLLILHYRWENA